MTPYSSQLSIPSLSGQTCLENDVQSNSSHESAYSTLCRKRLIFDAFFREVLVIDNDWLRDVAISEMDYRWSTEQCRRLLIPGVYGPECALYDEH